MTGEGNFSMACSDFEALLAEAVEGSLAAPQMERFRAHADACPHCGPLFTEALAGLEWLNQLEEVEPPRNLVRNILLATSEAETSRAVELGRGKGLADRMREALAPYLVPAWATVRQPKFAMSFGMAFFSLTLILNIAGLRLSDLKYLDLRPNAIRNSAMHTYDQASARVFKYYDNVRFVYEFQSRLRDLKNATEEPERTPQQQKRNQNYKDDHTSGQPDPSENKYSRDSGETLLASAPAGHRQFVGGSWPTGRRMA